MRQRRLLMESEKRLIYSETICIYYRNLNNIVNKIKSKNLNLIVANDVTLPGSGFGSDQNQVSIIDKNLNVQTIELASKYDVSNKILDSLHQLLT